MTVHFQPGRTDASAEQTDAQDDFVHDFVAAWTKVMTLDRFDLP